MRLSLSRRLQHFFFGRFGPTIEDVLTGGSVEHRGFLSDHRDLSAEGVLREITNVAITHTDRPFFHIV